MILLSAHVIHPAEDESVEIVDASIDIDHKQFYPVAYLCVTLKNNGDKKISNLTFEISYYDGEYLAQKAVVKNALKEALPVEETRKYKIPLKGDFVNRENAEYPYGQHDKANEFDVKILDVKYASK